MRLTELAGGGGCGCKLSPVFLRDLLACAGVNENTPNELLVGVQTADDAAVWRLSSDTALIATTDFFSPIVDDAGDFGRIAAANAISDVYAMGGLPLFALALLGMPKAVLPAETIAAILVGGRETCRRAGIVVAGGHSIDIKEPMYGLAVLGRVHPENLLTNAGAQPGDALLLGKPLGVGVLSAALKQGVLSASAYAAMRHTMLSLNAAGGNLAAIRGVHALTDVTGFGLLGHLAEVCTASHCGAAVRFANLPLLPEAAQHLQAGVVTGASVRNWDSVREKVQSIQPLADWQRNLLTDPQTSGGLLVSCAQSAVASVQAVFATHGQDATLIGEINGDAPHITVYAQ